MYYEVRSFGNKSYLIYNDIVGWPDKLRVRDFLPPLVYVYLVEGGTARVRLSGCFFSRLRPTSGLVPDCFSKIIYYQKKNKKDIKIELAGSLVN